ncbi:MAG: cytidylate kinase-like family protein [Acidobacteria bacterium]|nr:cytidylate kinase-like family protein [Acidobacteriota bacterium]MBV8892350.1 cytidylate kinase-like family protein [Acidobacteriota bacterium]MBV9483493.1 cytidylate kinase-like family protein [Acidobacteriota bacterium]
MFRLIAIEREYGCGGGVIAQKIADALGWKIWDRLLTEEIAKLANVDCSAVERRGERLDSRFYRLAKVFWRGSYERSIPLDDDKFFDADCLVSMMERIVAKIAGEGNAVVIGRGAPFFLREREDAFRVFLYATREEKLRRLMQAGQRLEDAEDMIDTIDGERVAFCRHYFSSDWPKRSLYHMMLNTAMGDEAVIATIFATMGLLDASVVRKSNNRRGVR